MNQSKRCYWLVITAMPFFVASTTQAGVEESELKEHFGEQQFAPAGGFILRQGQKLPDLVWEHPQLVARVVENHTIPTRWFNERFEEVRIAREAGRYYVYGEAPVPDGPVLRRAMTCCCVGKDVTLAKLAQSRLNSNRRASDSDRKQDDVDALVRRWQMSEEGAVELAALLEADLKSGPVRRGQWQMENATQHVRLKRKLMGLDRKPIIKVTPRPLKGKPAPVFAERTIETSRDYRSTAKEDRK